MDIKALFNLSYGLYIIGAKDQHKNAGCVANTVTQSTSSPVTLSVCLNKDNHTTSCIKASKEFSVSILSEKANDSIFKVFGFNSSKDKDKFSEAPSALTPAGLPYITEGVCGYLTCKVIDIVENFTHLIFIAEVVEAENLSAEAPMTYAYYHRVIKGKTPPKASSYAAETDKTAKPEAAYICSVCGYEYPGSKETFEQLPDTYTCPICGAPKDKFILKSTSANQ